tara:strand:+ start:404 stop:943 length:540 start_codon:yes stop_codon:yes gene_type:complete
LTLEQAFVVADKASHDLKTFDCGKTGMNDFLSRFAIKHNKLGLSRTWVLPEVVSKANTETAPTDSKKTIAAYFTLSTATVSREAIPAQHSLPTYPIPVIMLARLAIDSKYQGQGLGAKTLVTALRQARTLSQSGLPAYGLILDVLDEQALGFYNSFEVFQPFTDEPMRLFVGMKTLSDL